MAYGWEAVGGCYDGGFRGRFGGTRKRIGPCYCRTSDSCVLTRSGKRHRVTAWFRPARSGPGRLRRFSDHDKRLNRKQGI